MRVLYFCNVRKSNPTELGVLKKVIAQCNVMRKAGNIVFLACLGGDNYYSIVDDRNKEVYAFNIDEVSRARRDSLIFSKLTSFLVSEGIQMLYSRYSNFSLEAHKFYKNLKRNGIHCILEIPTYPLTQRWITIKQSFLDLHIKKAFVQTYDSTIGTLGIFFFKYSIERIVNNNGFERIWGIPVIPITNGIDVKTIPDNHRTFHPTSEVRIMSVANVANWHGFDRLIRGLAEYYKKPHDTIVRFQLAGPGMEVDLLRKLTKELHVEKYVEFLGTVVGEPLNELFLQSHIGISVLAVHRANMKEYDSLKAREFCARRLPFLTEEAETQYRGKPFVLYVPSNETPVDICKVVSFYNTIVSHPRILDEMRTYAETKCDWTHAFKNVVSYISLLDNDKSTYRR